jgi:dTMP kinase
MARGKFIALEGTDGAGITTQAELLKRWLDEQNRLSYLTKEPTAGPVGAIIRLALSRRLFSPVDGGVGSDGRFASIDSATLALMFAADRMDHLVTDIIPKVERGISVIADRYWLSSFAYQGVDLQYDWVRQINSKCLTPDLTIFLDVPAEIAKKRMDAQRWHVELFEDTQKLAFVRKNYHECIKKMQAEGHKIFILDGNQPVKVVRKNVVAVVRGLFSPAGVDSSDQLHLIDNVETQIPR